MGWICKGFLLKKVFDVKIGVVMDFLCWYCGLGYWEYEFFIVMCVVLNYIFKIDGVLI